jgi:hypothetical protein
MNKETLTKIDRYLKLIRYQYSTQEKLSRLKLIQDFYNTIGKDSCVESFQTKLEIGEQLSNDLKLPLKVKGVFLTEGRFKRRFYTAEELKKAAKNPINSSFPLMLDHRDNEAGKVIGVVDGIEYDPMIRGIRWTGHINDETFARNVLDGVIKDVSATVYATEDTSEILGIIGRDLSFKELSLVMDGACGGAYIEPVK